MSIWKQSRVLFRALRDGMPLGDLAVIKFEMLEGPSARMNARLRSLENPCLEVDINEMRALPDGTVGREFARLLDRNGLSPLTITQVMKERFAEKPYALRYTTTHDLFHLLTGFPTTPAGEVGLFAFMIAQGFADGSRRRLWQSVALYMLFAPLHVPGIVQNVRVGLAMGKKARTLMEEPLEKYLSEPLDVVRSRLGLPDPASAGIAPGHESLISRWLLPKITPKPAATPA